MRDAIEWARLAVFLGFVALGLRVALSARRAADGRPDRGTVDLLLVYVLVVSLLVGFTQKESWPFANWPLIHHLSPRRVTGVLAIEALDALGQSYVVDSRVWQPLAPEELMSWMQNRFRDLPPPAQERVARTLLEKAEMARQRVRRGLPVGTDGWLLGPLAAPHHFRPGQAWRSPVDVPATPFAGIRVVELEWDVEERLADWSRVTRRPVYELRDARAS